MGTRKLAWLALLACALALTGCGGGEPEPTGTPAPLPSEQPEPTPRAGGSISVPMPVNAKLENPLTVTSREMSSIYGLIYESLLEPDDTGMPGPCLAETWGSEDGVTWTFKLRSGVKWHEIGRDLDVSDVLFTLEQIKELGREKPWGFVTDYLKSWSAGTDGELLIELKKPFFGALNALTFPILPADVGYENGGSPEAPIGTGAYRFKSQKEGEIDLTANGDWWKKPPFIEDVRCIAFPDNATALSSLLLGQLDTVQTEDLTVTQYKESGDANVFEYRTRYLEYMAFNFNSSDLQDKLMRQAIAYAVDRLEVVSYTYVNHATISDTPVPPDSWFYDGKMLKYNFSTADARRLIRLTGWDDADNDGYWDTSPDGVKRNLTLTLLTNRDENNTIRNDAAVLMAGQLDKAGIKVEMKAAPWDEYIQMLNEKRFDLALCGCYLSPVPDYRPLLGTGGALNKGGYQSAEMDALLDDIFNSPTGDVLKVKMGELQTKVIEDLPIMCLYFRTHSLLTSVDLLSTTGSVSGAREDSAFARISQWYKAN